MGRLLTILAPPPPAPEPLAQVAGGGEGQEAGAEPVVIEPQATEEEAKSRGDS